jgi:hypothetical protein
LYKATTPCDQATPHFWKNLSFVELQSLEPCVNESSLAGNIIGDFTMGGRKLVEGGNTGKEGRSDDDDDDASGIRSELTTPLCKDDGFNSTGGGGGSWMSTVRRLDLWQPFDCRYEPATKEELSRFVSRVSVLVWGDSVSEKFADMLKEVAYRSKHTVMMRKVNAYGQNGLGIASLFLEPSSYLLGERWRALLDDMHAADVIVMNSGLHDLAPYFNIQHGGWYGDKAEVFFQFEKRIELVFKAIADDEHSRNGILTRHRVLWRSTSYPHLFWDRQMDRGGSAWYRRCDSQRLSISSVKRLNKIALEAGKKYGIPIWDISSLSVAATPAHAADGVHPSALATFMWVQVFYRHAVTQASARAKLGDRGYENLAQADVIPKKEMSNPRHRRKRSDIGAAARKRKSPKRIANKPG